MDETFKNLERKYHQETGIDKFNNRKTDTEINKNCLQNKNIPEITNNGQHHKNNPQLIVDKVGHKKNKPYVL